MMRKGGQTNKIIGIDSQRIAIRCGSIGHAVHLEGLRHFTQISVHDAVETLHPVRGEFLVGIRANGIQVTAQAGVQLALDGQRSTIVHAGIGFLGDDAVIADHLQHIAEITALSEVQLAVQTDIFDGAVVIGIAHHEHFGQVRPGLLIGQVLGLDGLGLQEGKGREAPAGAAAILILDGGDGVLLHRGKMIVFDGKVGLFLLGGQGAAKQDTAKEQCAKSHCIFSLTKNKGKDYN